MTYFFVTYPDQEDQFRKTSGVLKICTKGARTGTITSYALNYQITLTLTDLE